MPRAAVTVAAFAGFASLGLTAAGLVSALPPQARLLAVFAGLVFAPAVILINPLSRRVPAAGRHVPAQFALAALSVLTVFALAAQLCTLLSLRFSFYVSILTWGAIAFHAIVFGLGRVARKRAARRWHGSPFWLIALFAVVVFAAAVPPRYSGAEDAFDHIGYTRRLITMDSMQPGGVLAMPVAAKTVMPADPRKGAFHPFVAASAEIARVDPMAAWGALRMLMFPLALAAFVAFSSLFVPGAGALWACVALFIVSYGGTAFRFVNASGYGQNLAADWCWVLAATALSAPAAGRARGWVLCVVAVGGVLVHMGVALHALVLVLTLAIFPRALGLTKGNAWRSALWIGAGAALGVALRVAADGFPPEVNAMHAHAQGIMRTGGRWLIMSPMEVLRQYGMVFLGGVVLIPFALPAARARPGIRAALAMAALPVSLAFVPPVATLVFDRVSYMAFRVLLNAPMLPIVVLTIAWWTGRARSRGWLARAAIAGLVVAWGLAFLAPSLRAFAADASGRGPVADDGHRLDAAVVGLPAGSTVLSDPLTSYRLSAETSFTFVAVLQQHANPADPLAFERLRAVRNALSPFVIPEDAVAVCREYGVDFVALSAAPRRVNGFMTPGDPRLYGLALARLRSMPESFREVASGDDFTLFRFDARGMATNDWSGVPPPVRVGSGPAAGCAVPVPGDCFEITGFAVAPRTVAPGDSITVTFGYHRDAPSAYGFPLLFHIRADHETVAPDGWPGDKFVRRTRERWGGGLQRFRLDAQPGHGIYEPDLWPMGTDLVEKFRFQVPAAALPGAYRVELSVARETLLPNFDLRDIFYNHDHYSGVPCDTLILRAR
ncbi:MAG TPA: hypothetical protein VFX92_05180 [Candidatus Krumholzibacteria bacterium]|nr:hypothetical protein [Candidatus Krumholzibacteria bacterium]